MHNVYSDAFAMMRFLTASSEELLDLEKKGGGYGRYGNYTLQFCKKPLSIQNEILCLERWGELARYIEAECG